MKRFFTSGLSYLYNIHHFTSISIILVHSKKSGYRRTDHPTDHPSIRRTDRPSYRDGWTHLKTRNYLNIKLKVPSRCRSYTGPRWMMERKVEERCPVTVDLTLRDKSVSYIFHFISSRLFAFQIAAFIISLLVS